MPEPLTKSGPKTHGHCTEPIPRPHLQKHGINKAHGKQPRQLAFLLAPHWRANTTTTRTPSTGPAKVHPWHFKKAKSNSRPSTKWADLRLVSEFALQDAELLPNLPFDSASSSDAIFLVNRDDMSTAIRFLQRLKLALLLGGYLQSIQKILLDL